MLLFTGFSPSTRQLIGASLGAMMALNTTATAQDKIEWKQTFQYDDSQSIPSGLSLDVLGIKIGDTYEVAKAKLEQIAKDDGKGERVRVTETYFLLPTGGGASLETKFPSQLTLQLFSETITVFVSSPASGSQVYALDRLVRYYEKSDQVKISAFLPKIAQKYGGEPHVRSDFGSGVEYRIQYDNTQTITPTNDPRCSLSGMKQWGKSEAKAQKINVNGNCDVLIDIQFNRGISPDHAKDIWFHIADLERAKATIGADYQYFRDYLDALKSGGGAEPKL